MTEPGKWSHPIYHVATPALILGNDFVTLQLLRNIPLSYTVGVRRQFAKENLVDNTLTDQSSIIRFIEDNWNLGRIGNGSFDELAGSLLNMFDFDHEPHEERLFLDPNTGEPCRF